MSARSRFLLALPVLGLCAGAALLSSRTAESAVVAQGMVSGGTDVLSDQKLAKVASVLAGTFGRTPENVATRLRQLKAAPGAGLFVEVKQEGTTRPAVVLEPSHGSEAALLVNGEISVDVPDQDEAMAVFWVQGGTQEQYRVRVPVSVSHVTVVLNGRAVAAARRIDSHSGQTVIR